MPYETSGWLELGRTAQSVVTAVTAIIGVCFAKAGLDKWRIEMIGKRKTELAEEALIAFYEARDVLRLVRMPNRFGSEGSSRTPEENESGAQLARRNSYFIPIERLASEKQLFARLQSLRYAFAAHFGERGLDPFAAIYDVHNRIMISTSVLIQRTLGDDDDPSFQRDAEPLLNEIGWRPAVRPDDIDRKIDKAIRDIETICRPVLTGSPNK